MRAVAAASGELLIAHRPAGLYDGRHTRVRERLLAVGERKNASEAATAPRTRSPASLGDNSRSPRLSGGWPNPPGKRLHPSNVRNAGKPTCPGVVPPAERFERQRRLQVLRGELTRVIADFDRGQVHARRGKRSDNSRHHLERRRPHRDRLAAEGRLRPRPDRPEWAALLLRSAHTAPLAHILRKLLETWPVTVAAARRRSLVCPAGQRMSAEVRHRSLRGGRACS